jgi:hypothetical protein
LTTERMRSLSDEDIVKLGTSFRAELPPPTEASYDASPSQFSVVGRAIR